MHDTVMKALGAVASVALLAGASSCTEVTEKYPEGGCEAGAVRCHEGNLERCNPGQTAFEVTKQCEGECGGSPPDCEGKVLIGDGGPSCESDQQCVDQLGQLGECYAAVCNEGVCAATSLPDDTECNDDNACTDGDRCSPGTAPDTSLCRGTPIVCDDKNPCTDDSCDSVSACLYTPSTGAECDDGEPCTKNDVCGETGCAGLALDCDDGNPCTVDQCSLDSGECAYTPLVGECSDGDPCTVGDECIAKECVGTPSCQCDPTVENDCAKYNLADPCKGDYICVEEYCALDASTAFQCSQDGLGTCETNTCVNNEGTAECLVESKPDGGACDDGSACTTGDVCQEGGCVGTVDVTIPGCGFFRIGWYSVAASAGAWSLDGQAGEATTLRAVVGYPVFFGEATGGDYRVRAIAPGL